MRSKFDGQLAQLNSELIAMGALCENAIAAAAKALLDGDTALIGSVSEAERSIDQKERDIEALCIQLLLRQQPVAHDLRQVSAALKMITDMERIGDQADDIAEIVSYLGGKVGNECPQLGDMARAAIRMVTESVDAYTKRDLAMAKAVIEYDDVVDGHFVEAKRVLAAMLSARPDRGEYVLDLLMIAKYFERIGDHATNIAEWVVFAVTGEHAAERADKVSAPTV